jgi:hypothetical protein
LITVLRQRLRSRSQECGQAPWPYKGIPVRASTTYVKFIMACALLLAVVPKRFIRSAVCVVWLLGTAVFGLHLISYENAAGPQTLAKTTFPKQSGVALDANRLTLLLFAHPKCPCTRATVNELNRLLAHCDNNVAAHVYFLRPSSETDDWTKTDLWRNAASIPGVQVHTDTDSVIASQFGASTSGDVVLFDPKGKLLFHGGITAGRGHEGDNPGAIALIALATGVANSCKQTPVYGCLLQRQCNATTETTQ